MSLPTNSDYLNAIQNPRQCFNDIELRSGTPVVDRYGLPKIATGNFAAVFQINSNNHKHAVKCFTKYQPDQEERYAAISSYLQSKKLPYVIEFKFLSQGIKVKDKWHPALKMEWVEGDTLGSYVEKNLDNSRALQNLAKNFLGIARNLRQHNIAHGDLQHGNVIVVENSLRLVDYDGMFVPGLENNVATEVGHPNYQHPARGKHFGPFLDNFSVWVIYLSLIALSVDNSLWSKLKLDEDCLVFRKNDFSSPETSEALHALDKSPNQNIRGLAATFRSLIYTQDLKKLPPLEDNPFIQNFTPVLSSKRSDWITDYTSSTTANISKKMVIEQTGASWVLDHIQSNGLITYKSSFALERLVIALYGVFVATIILSSSTIILYWQLTGPWLLLSIMLGTSFLLASGFAAVFLILRARYYNLPEVKEKTNLGKEINDLKEQIIQIAAEKNIEYLNARRNQLNKQEETTISAIMAKQQESTQREKSEISKIEIDLQTKLTRLNIRQTEIKTHERSDLAKALQDFQNEYLQKNLMQHTINHTNIPGIGQVLKQRLLSGGIRTAADIHSHINVAGVGRQKLNTLIVWRQNLEKNLRTQFPRVLSVHQEENIKAIYRTQIAELKTEETKVQQATQKAIKSIRERYGAEYLSVPKNIMDTKNKYVQQRQEIDKQIANIKQRLAEKKWALSKTRKMLDTYQHIETKTYLRQIFLGSQKK